jgi:hypothetical protein
MSMALISMRRRLSLIGLGALVAAASGCIHVFVRTDVVGVNRPSGEARDSIRSPIKAHLADGSTVLFPNGGAVSATEIRGFGQHYPLLGDVAKPRSSVPMDSIVAVEAFNGRSFPVQSLVVSAAATALLPVALVAIFGSCPTVYVDSGGAAVLQAEGFSYALSPLMEHRDLDPLRVSPDANGVIRLELRNEAMETHFLNHIELVTARHPVGTRLVPDQHGQPVTVAGFATLSGARDRAGRDVLATLTSPDGTLYSTAPSIVRSAREGDLDDWIDLDVTDLPPGDSLVVLLRLRNSLLNTILLYEGMLGGRDAADWLSNDLNSIGRAVDLARWYTATMGMRLTVDGVTLPADGPYRGHARLADVGPIAYRDVAVVLPRPSVSDGRARVRLAFVADNWRIDEVRVAGRHSRPASRTIALASVIVPTPAVGHGPVLDTAAVPRLAAADEQYLETRPGQRMTLVFDPVDGESAPAGQTDTYLIAWQGWYSEWLRPQWLATPTRTGPFVPGDAAMLTALRRWTERQPTFERDFYASSIPVR